MKPLAKFQIGKFGITPGSIESLGSALKTHRQVRVSVLKSFGRNKSNMETIAKEITSKLKQKCNYRIIGFTIIINRGK